jgi:hypothetical protein
MIVLFAMMAGGEMLTDRLGINEDTLIAIGSLLLLAAVCAIGYFITGSVW